MSYWNLRSNGFSDMTVYEMNQKYTEWQSRLLHCPDVAPGSSVLDVGCGPGFFSMIMGSAGMRVTGIDFSEEMLNHAGNNCKINGIEAEFLKADVQELGFEDETFDLIVSRNVIWNLEHPEKAYREMYRVLKPNGIIKIFDGNFYLHLHDEDYKTRYRIFSETEGVSHETFNKDRVDFGIMEELAYNLPLSKVRRPQWDVSLLREVGFDIDSTTFFGGGFTAKENGRDFCLADTFQIVALKGVI